MKMTQSYLTLIETRLRDTFSPTYLQVLDESNKHIGHAGYQGGGRHFAITIMVADFNNLSRIEAHRKIYDLFSDLLPDSIHALRIKIL